MDLHVPGHSALHYIIRPIFSRYLLAHRGMMLAIQEFLHRQKSDILACMVLVVVLIAAMAVINPTCPYPVNDEFCYVQSVQQCMQLGRLTLGTSQAACYVPIALGWAWTTLFGFNCLNLRILVAGLSVCSTLLMVFSLRLTHTSRVNALAIAALMAFLPIQLNLSSLYMTDLFGHLFLSSQLYFMIKAVSARNAKWLWLAQISLLLAIFSRQQLFVCFVPLLYVQWFLGTRKPIFYIAHAVIPVLGFFAAQQLLALNELSSASSFMTSLFGDHLAKYLHLRFWASTSYKASIYIGLLLSPLVIFRLIHININHLTTRVEKVKIAALAAVLIIIASVGAFYNFKDGGTFPFYPNMINLPRIGVVNVLGPIEPIITNRWVPRGIELFGLFAFFVLIIVSVVRQRDSTESVEDLRSLRCIKLSAAAMLALLSLEAILMTQVQIIDRYFYVVICPGAILLGVGCSKLAMMSQYSLLKKSLCGTLIVGSVLYGLMSNIDYWNLINTRGELIDLALESGCRPTMIDGGPEFNFSVNPALMRSLRHTGNGNAEFPRELRGNTEELRNMRWWPVTGENMIISTKALNGYHIYASRPYHSLIVGRDFSLFLLKLN